MISAATQVHQSCSSSAAPHSSKTRVVTPHGIAKPACSVFGQNVVNMRVREGSYLPRNVGFMSRKLNFIELTTKNAVMAEKIAVLSKPEREVQGSLQQVQDHVAAMRKRIEIKRMMIQQKKEEIKKISKQLEVSQKVADDSASKQHVIKNVCAQESLRLDKKRQHIDDKIRTTDEKKRLKALELMTVFFPLDQIKRSVVGEDDSKIREQMERHNRVRLIADAMADVNIPRATPTMGYWGRPRNTEHGESSSDHIKDNKDNEFFSIADCRINDHCLYDSLRAYLVFNRSTDISDEDRHAYAAFTHCIHVVHNLSVILDFKLPFHISLSEIMKSRWTENLFDTTVFKLNVCIVRLCLAQGLPSDVIRFHRPFYNLLKLCEKFRKDLQLDPPAPIAPCVESLELTDLIQSECDLLTWEDTKDMDDWIKI